MKLLAIFGWGPTSADLVQRQRAEEADHRIVELAGDVRNQAQAMQSHSRRLATMARTMALLRDGVRE